MRIRDSLIFLGVMLLTAVGLNACNLPDESELPRCNADQLQAPTSLSPHGESAVVDPAPNLYLYWEYPSTTCQPDHFELYLWTGLEPEIPGMKVRVPYSQTYSPGRWRAPWGVPLTPGNTYYWRVYAGLETGPGPDVSGPDTWGYFFTGPVCAPETDYQPVLLMNPADEAVITSPTESILFAWDDPTPCLVDYVFEFQIWSPNPEFDWSSPYLRRIPILQSVFPRTPVQLDLQGCTRYYWRIKTDPAGPQEDPFSETRSFVTNFHGSLCPAVFVKPAWIFTFPRDLLCREGPGLDYGIHSALLQGEQVTIEGRNEDRTWWYLETEIQRRCWAPDEVIDLIEGWERIPILDVELPNYKPRCPTENLLAPALNSPSDGEVITDTWSGDLVTPTWPFLTWTYPDRTCDPAGYRIQLSVDPTFADTGLGGGTGNPSTRWAPANPLQDCQLYYWRVAAINDITLGPFSESWSFRIDAERSCLPFFRFTRNAFCRSGPGQIYKELTGITSGELVEVIGRDQQSSWWYISWEKHSVRCWVSAVTGQVIGNPDQVPVVDVPPPTLSPSPLPPAHPEATPTPESCSRYKDSKTCEANSACRWVLPATSGLGYCTGR
jgi:uncharacterized protein YraI